MDLELPQLGCWRFVFEAAQQRLAKVNKPRFAPAFLGWLERTRDADNLHQPAWLRRHQENTIAEINGFLNRVRDQKYCALLLFPKINEQLLHPQPNTRIKRAKWLVHK